MSTDFRAELQRLVKAIKNWDFDTGSLEQDWSALDRAEAALAHPEPVTPTDEELEDLAEVMNVSGNPVPAMRRALELWGNSQGILDSSPQPQPPNGYAYRYPDGIRFNNGRNVNGCRPSEVIPYWFRQLPANALPTPEAKR